MKTDSKLIADMFKALGDENRIKILLILKNGEICACKLLEELNITQPTLSHHMKLLCDAEIVCCRKEGKWSYYSISERGIDVLKEFFDNILKTNTESQKSCC